MTSSIVKYSVERFFLVKTFWLRISKSTPNDPKGEKKAAGQIRSAGQIGPTGQQNRRPFFSRFGPFGVDLQKFFSGKIFIQKNFKNFEIYRGNT